MAYMKMNAAASRHATQSLPEIEIGKKIKEQDTDMRPTVGDTVYEA
jgi:hypothetical protein